MTDRLPFPQTIARPAPIGSLLKRRGNREPRRRVYRSGRETDSAYLDLIRQLPCLNCGLEPCREAAHVRLNSAAFGKRQAIGQKPDDRWSLPLDAACHRLDPDSQHKVGEGVFWDRLGLNPLLICEALQKVSPDVVKMRAVVFSFMAERPALTSGERR